VSADPWSVSERHLLAHLDAVCREAGDRGELVAFVEQVEDHLLRNPQSVMSWTPIPLDRYRGRVPQGILSSWAFGLRAGSTSGAERHPNSHQRMVSIRGEGTLQMRSTLDRPWHSLPMTSDPMAALEQRWASVPVNHWHQVVVPDTSHWVVVSFHTAHEHELLEERPPAPGGSDAHQRRYVDHPFTSGSG
jgi:hypothetical protein